MAAAQAETHVEAATHVDVVGVVAPLTANVLSFGGCVWLIWRLLHLPHRNRRRLFPLQLTLLSLSDIVFHVGCSFNMAVGYLAVGLESGDGTLYCGWGNRFVTLGTNASSLVEMHIAVSFLVQSFGWAAPLRWMPCSLLMLWPVALGYTVAEWSISGDVHQDPEGWCVHRDYDFLFPSLLLTTFAVSIASYLSSVCQAEAHANLAVARSNWRRAAAYPLNFMLTQVMMVYVVLFLPAPQSKRSPIFIIAVTLQSLNGLVNMLVYGMQSRYAKRIFSTEQMTATQNVISPNPTAPWAGPSHQPRFGGVTVQEILPSAFLESSSGRSLQTSSTEPREERRCDAENGTHALLAVQQSLTSSARETMSFCGETIQDSNAFDGLWSCNSTQFQIKEKMVNRRWQFQDLGAGNCSMTQLRTCEGILAGDGQSITWNNGNVWIRRASA